jgi:hypothetical protein
VQKNKKFVNPLTKSTEATIQENNTATNISSTYMSTYTSLSTSTDTDTYISTPTQTYTQSPNKRKKQRFEDTHERLTLWVDKNLKQGFETLFEALIEEQDISKTALLNEALSDLLKKYGYSIDPILVHGRNRELE